MCVPSPGSGMGGSGSGPVAGWSNGRPERAYETRGTHRGARPAAGPGGCAWDPEQTHDSLVQYLVEETYELVDAIETGEPRRADRGARRRALPGDLPLRHRRHRPGEFTLEDVAAHMTAKMVGGTRTSSAMRGREPPMT